MCMAKMALDFAGRSKTDHGRAYVLMLRRLVLLVAAVVCADTARAEPAYPTRPVALVVTVPPGGAADFVARIIAAKLADALGQPVIVANRGGAAGTTAAAGVAKSDPDGYTLLLNTVATHGIGPHLYPNLPYDPVKDFSPIILVAKLPLDHDGQCGVAGAIGRGRHRARQGSPGTACLRVRR